MALSVSQILLIALGVWGLWTLWGFPYNNGLLQILKSMTLPGAKIPGPTVAPMRQTYTGIRVIDNQLTVLVSFFFTATDGNRADVSLQFLDLGGQVLAAWTLITIESLRSGNDGKWIITSTTILGLLVALIGFAVAAPLWFAVHLGLSPTTRYPKDHQLILDSPVQLAIAPISIMLGFGLPSVIMSLAAPNVISFDHKQLWTGIQQGWPLWIALAQFVLTILVNSLNSSASLMRGDDQRVMSLRYLRRAYAFALISSAGAHLTAWGISMLAYTFPVLFTSPYVTQLQPSNVFSPVNPFGSYQAKTLADGALWFLQWDLITGTVATLVWAVAVKGGTNPGAANLGQWISSVIQLIVLSAIVGPCGAAVVAIWSRDERVFQSSTSTDRNIVRKSKAI